MKEASKKTISGLVNQNIPNTGQLLENSFLRSVAGMFPRSPEQLNRFLEADAELITMGDGAVLALSYDAITEELETGLYADPYLAGWMTVVISLSDLAATGSEPLGLLLDLRFPTGFCTEKLKALQKGISNACLRHGTYILGGDTNPARQLYTGSTAIGIIDDGTPMTRKGCQPGDVVYASARLGSGGGFAYSRISGSKPFPYLPLARIPEGKILRRHASSCIDTSDGFFPAACQLIELNEIGINLTVPLETMLEKDTSELANATDMPGWFFLAGPHGEFELLFTIPANRELAFLQAAKAQSWQPVKLGTIISDPGSFYLPTGRRIDPFVIANLYSRFPDPEKYIQALFNLHEKLQL